MKTNDSKRREDGFEGEQFVVLSERDRLRCAAHPIASQLYPLTFGYQPSAPGHLVHRKVGKRGCSFLFVLKGKGTLELGGKTFSVKHNNAFIIPSFTGHTYEADSQNPWSTLWVRFEGGLEENYRKLLGATLDHPLLYLPNAVILFERYRALYASRKLFYQDLDLIELSNTLGLFLTEAIKCIRPEGAHRLSNDEKIQKSIRFMKDNMHRTCTLKELAATAGLSERHYSRAFHSITGVSPAYFLLDIKINEAILKLQSTDLPINLIAKSLGYEDPLYFSRFFHKTQGVSPSQYRQRKS